MKAIVKKEFRDKYTGVVYPIGKMIEVSKKRFDEILSVDELIEEIVDEEIEDKTKSRKKK